MTASYVRVPDGAALEDLLELRSAKRGGIKRAAVHKVGPAREVRGRHPDGREFALSLQVALKDGAVAGPARGVAVIKPLRPAKGDPVSLRALPFSDSCAVLLCATSHCFCRTPAE